MPGENETNQAEISPVYFSTSDKVPLAVPKSKSGLHFLTFQFYSLLKLLWSICPLWQKLSQTFFST